MNTAHTQLTSHFLVTDQHIWHPLLFTPRSLHANDPFRDNLITQWRLRLVLFLCLVRISLGRNGNFILKGANISLGMWKIPFKWSQAEKRQRICLAFCLTVFTEYMQFASLFFFLVAHRRVLGTQMERKGEEGVVLTTVRTVWPSLAVTYWRPRSVQATWITMPCSLPSKMPKCPFSTPQYLTWHGFT